MIQTHTFIKDQRGWAIELPGSIFTRGQRAMVCGADTFLDILAQGENKVTLNIASDFHEGYNQLRRTELIGGVIGSLVNGAMYMADTYNGIDYQHSIYLCPVTLFIFNHYPSTIYYQVA